MMNEKQTEVYEKPAIDFEGNLEVHAGSPLGDLIEALDLGEF